jgi:hypothetical protein
MSEADREVVELSGTGDAAFSSLMDALAPEEPAAEVGDGAKAEGGTPAPSKDAPAAGTDSDGGGDAAAGQQPATQPPATQPAADRPGGAADGSPAEPATVSQPADLPADWTADADSYIPKLGQLSTVLEEKVTKEFQEEAFNAAREEYENYFKALETHPRLLVGTEVPAIGKEGMERLKDSDDAKEWQEAVRGILIEDIEERTQTKLEESGGYLQTLHASIDLFKSNPDLIPGTKNFDRALADEFAKLAEPYEVRNEGKLQGYSIPVQPIIDALRSKRETAKSVPDKVEEPSPPASASSQPGEASRPVDPPQAGIPSKAGSTSESEDFSTLFGTIGLPHLQI